MSRARHEAEALKCGGKVRAKGGEVEKEEVYEGKDSKTEEEAEKRKRGGAIHKGKMPTMIHGEAPKFHSNRPGRKSGGAVGVESHPMSSASKLSGVEGLSRDG